MRKGELNYEDLRKESNLDFDSLDQIDKDIKRTFFPAYFEMKDIEEKETKTAEEIALMKKLLGENDLMRTMARNILIAYSTADRKIGYVQGFNSIVAAFIYIFHQARQASLLNENRLELDLTLRLSEEEIFFTFYGLMTYLGWRSHFFNGMDDINKMCNDFSERLKREDSDLYDAFFSNGVCSSSLRFLQWHTSRLSISPSACTSRRCSLPAKSWTSTS